MVPVHGVLLLQTKPFLSSSCALCRWMQLTYKIDLMLFKGRYSIFHATPGTDLIFCDQELEKQFRRWMDRQYVHPKYC